MPEPLHYDFVPLIQMESKDLKADGYEWSFVDPGAPAGNNIVFDFTFLKRIP